MPATYAGTVFRSEGAPILNLERPDGISEADTNLLRDPQTSGGLLVACSADAADEVVRLFREAGHPEARVPGAPTCAWPPSFGSSCPWLESRTATSEEVAVRVLGFCCGGGCYGFWVTPTLT